MACSLPASSVHGILQAKNTGMGCHFLIQGNLPSSGTEPTSPASPALAGKFFITKPAGKPLKPVSTSWRSQLPNYTQSVWTQNCISTCMGGHILRLHQHWMGCWCEWAQETQVQRSPNVGRCRWICTRSGQDSSLYVLAETSGYGRAPGQ